MKSGNLIALVLVGAVAGIGGWYVGKHPTGSNKGVAPSGGRKIVYYQSPMHPWIKSDKPGNCTICGMRLTPVYEGETGVAVAPDLVSLNSNTLNVLHVQTAEVTKRPLELQLQVAGRIESDETRYRVISAYVDGRIDKLFVNYIGAEVQSGQPLALIYSPALLTAQREYLTLLGQKESAANKQLAEENERMLDAARQRLKRLGLTESQIASADRNPGSNYLTQVVAPISGTVVTRSVFEGQYAKEGDKLFEIADLSRMWFRFDVYEQDLAWIKIGQTVTVTTPSKAGKTFDGKIVFIDPNINEATRSARVRVELENPATGENGNGGRELYNGLYADGTIVAKSEPVLAISRSAVLQPGNNARVYVDKGGGAYQQRTIKLGRKGGEYWEVVNGLSEGEQVVQAGNLLLDSQAELNKGAMAEDTHDHPENRKHHEIEEEKTTERVPEKPIHLTEEQLRATKQFLEFASSLGKSLSADDLKEYNKKLEQTRSVTEDLRNQFQEVPHLNQLADVVVRDSNLRSAENLDAARKSFMPYAAATADFTRALAAHGVAVSAKVYKCPMYPALGKTAFWIQTEGPLQNPFYGSAMIDCGTEVK